MNDNSEIKSGEAPLPEDPTAFPAERKDPKSVTFTIGETIYPGNLEATFRVVTVGRNGMGITNTSPKVIVPKAPYLVRFKGILFKVCSAHGRDFNIQRVLEE